MIAKGGIYRFKGGYLTKYVLVKITHIRDISVQMVYLSGRHKGHLDYLNIDQLHLLKRLRNGLCCRRDIMVRRS